MPGNNQETTVTHNLINRSFTKVLKKFDVFSHRHPVFPKRTNAAFSEPRAIIQSSFSSQAQQYGNVIYGAVKCGHFLCLPLVVALIPLPCTILAKTTPCIFDYHQLRGRGHCFLWLYEIPTGDSSNHRSIHSTYRRTCRGLSYF